MESLPHPMGDSLDLSNHRSADPSDHLIGPASFTHSRTNGCSPGVRHCGRQGNLHYTMTHKTAQRHTSTVVSHMTHYHMQCNIVFLLLFRLLFVIASWKRTSFMLLAGQSGCFSRTCPHCEVLLLGPRHHDHSYVASAEHPFLMAKKYTPAANLMRPSEEYFECIQLLDGEFARNINTFWPRSNITNNLEMTLENLGDFNSLLSTHPEHASLIESISIKKFVMCRNKLTANRKLSTFTT